MCKAYDSARASDLNSSLPHPTAFNAHQQNAKVGECLVRPAASTACSSDRNGVFLHQQKYRWPQATVGRAVVRVARYLKENEYLLVVAASTMIMSLSHTALRPVLPVFAKVRSLGACCAPPQGAWSCAQPLTRLSGLARCTSYATASCLAVCSAPCVLLALVCANPDHYDASKPHAYLMLWQCLTNRRMGRDLGWERRRWAAPSRCTRLRG